MSADGKRLQGEVVDEPRLSSGDIERLLQGFLHALVQEQQDYSQQQGEAK